MKVYKYDLTLGYTPLILPVGAKILHFDIQRDIPRIWVLVNPEASTEKRRFVIYGTGHEIKETKSKLKFIGTALMCDGHFVWHLFEVHSFDKKVNGK